MTDASSNPAPGVPPPPPPPTTGTPQPDIFDSHGNLTTDIPCHACSYNLRGLSTNHRCPECGTPVGVSIHGDLLRFADPDWIEKLARGGRLVIYGITTQIGLIILSTIGVIYLAIFLRNPALLSSDTLVRLAAGALHLAAVALAGAGLWLCTTIDPGQSSTESPLSTRRLARTALLIYLVVEAVTTASRVLPPTLGAICALAGIITSAIAAMAYLKHMRTLTDRIPDPGLSSRAGLLFWLVAILSAAMLAATLGGLALARMGAPGIAPTGPFAATAPATMPTTATALPRGGGPTGLGLGFFACVSVSLCAVSIGGLVAFLMFVIWQAKLGRAFRAQANLARTTWAARAAPESNPVPPPPAP
jgi:hypothetical protein